MLDLVTLDTGPLSEAGVEFEVRHPKTGDPLGCYITVLGEDAVAYREARLRIVSAMESARVAAGGELTAAQVDSFDAQFAAIRIKGWREFEFEGACPYNPDNALRVCKRLSWLREQVRQKSNDRGLFLPGSAKP